MKKGLIKDISQVDSLLEAKYHSPRLGNKLNPLNELLYIKLSLRTTGPSFERVYADFKRRFPRWEDVYKAEIKDVAEALFNAGLSNQKARNLKNILHRLKTDFGRVSLAPLKDLSDLEVEDYLCSLPGVGKKSARCIMLYSFDREVFPVDAHCFRIIRRLRWVEPEIIYNDRIADEIQEMIPPRLRYSLHVNMVAHGRTLCLERYPKCNVCTLLRLCPFGQERVGRLEKG